MKIFEKGDKTNFVDNNNVILGWDSGQSCCESHGWFFAPHPTNDDNYQPQNEDPGDLEDWSFDPSYFQQLNPKESYDEGGLAVFRIVKGSEERFLHLYNLHNGYYAHGFELEVGGKTIVDEYI